MNTMTATPHVYHMPTYGRRQRKGRRYEFYRDHFVSCWPADTQALPVSRTVGAEQIVDELVMSFTHDVVMDALLPGVPPSGKKCFCSRRRGAIRRRQDRSRAYLSGPS